MRISELVKTYKLLNDPNAPDWNVKFVGGIVVAAAIVAAGGFALYVGGARDGADVAPAATVSAAEPPACSAEDVAAATLAAPQDAPFEKGERLASGCVVR